MNNKSFFHQIIWIPNYVVKPRENKLAHIENGGEFFN